MRKKGLKKRVSNKLDTVGVRGSIPRSPTIYKLPPEAQIVEIPNEYEVVPAVSWDNGVPRLYRVLVRKPVNKCDFSVTSRRTSKSKKSA